MEVVEVLVREVESFDEGAMALFAFGKDEDVVSQDPGVDWPGSEHVDPRLEEGGDEEHAEGAALWDSTWVHVRLANMPTQAVVEGKLFLKPNVRVQNAGGKTHAAQDRVEDWPQSLIEAFPDVRRSA